MKSWEVLRDAIEKIGVKAIAHRLNLSTALVYKWCQESPQDDPDSSGALNPLDRLREIYEATRDERILNWVCQLGNGTFVPNPQVSVGQQDVRLLDTTQQVVVKFGELLSAVSRSVQNDGRITADEADNIRQCWEQLKSKAETFVMACEKGMYGRAQR